MMSNPEWKELHTEYPPSDEAEDIQAMLELSIHFHEKQDGVYRRGQHAKDTGCLKAEFIVEPELPTNLKYGVFREPKTFEAIVRFSNGSGQLRSDKIPDGRGMSIKLLDVEGTKVLPSGELHQQGEDRHQDFIMIANPTFSFSDVKNYLTFFQLRKELGNAESQKKFFQEDNPQLGKVMLEIVKVIDNPLDVQYWSMSPYSLGTQAIKFSAKPQVKHSNTPVEDDNYLFSILEETIEQEDVYFDFLIQLQTDPQKTPIEDTSIEWKEEDAPFYKVATVKIHKQEVDPEFRQRCETLAWNPWHALAEHKPLGGINRLRRAIYWDSAMRRSS